MRRRYLDVMALVHNYDKIDIFLRVTCTCWPELVVYGEL